MRVSLANRALAGRLGRVDAASRSLIRAADITDLLDEMDAPLGRLTFVRHAALLSETPAHWERPPTRLGAHAPLWPEPEE